MYKFLNKKMNLKKNLGRLMKRNNSYDFTFQDNLSLNQLDEEYINNKVIQNEKRQLAAYNQLKKYREMKKQTKQQNKKAKKMIKIPKRKIKYDSSSNE